jgi:hypothetical protein
MQLFADDLASLDARAWREPLRGRRRSRPLPWLRMGVFSAGIVAGLAYLAGQQPEPSQEPGSIPLAALLAPPPAWQAVAEPVPLYAVEGIDPNSFVLEVRRHVGGGREDTLTFGSFGEAGYGRLRATRGATEPESASFYVDLVRQAAQAGLSVVRSTQVAPLGTKLGPAEIAAVTMSGTAEAACLAFRVGDRAAEFALRGWVCGAAEQPASEAQVACLLERFTLASRDDPALTALFTQAERRWTAGCAPASVHMSRHHDAAAGETEPGTVERMARPPQPTRSARSSRPRRS